MILFCGLFIVTLFFPFYSTSPSLAEQPLFKKYIIEFNLKTLEQSLADDSYRGEEGILNIRPEEARSLGMKVVIDEDYLESMRLFEEADKCLEKAKGFMSSDSKEKISGYYAKEISENFLKYKKNFGEAKMRLMNYHSRLNQRNDDRLDEALCLRMIDRILEEAFGTSGKGLRDNLAIFFNRCHGVDSNDYPLTSKNVRFVNYVFNGFLKEASEEEKKKQDLDLDRSKGNAYGSSDWKDAAGFGTSEYFSLLEASLKKLGDTIYPVDPLLFMALIKKESGFDPSAVSPVGAAGLTQIMPETAKELGMKNIFLPEYYFEAVSLMKSEREAKNKALSSLFQIQEEETLTHAEQARTLMQESITLGLKRAELYERYEKELLKNRDDERLQASTAIEYGLKYFAGLMKQYKGDISLALASYNAGEYRVRDFNGIPPYKETVNFRNRILTYYNDYLAKVIDR